MREETRSNVLHQMVNVARNCALRSPRVRSLRNGPILAPAEDLLDALAQALAARQPACRVVRPSMREPRSVVMFWARG